MSAFEQPEESSGEILAVELLENALVQRGVAHWRDLKGERPFPYREEISPRGLGPALHNVILVKVLPDDYEYRIVGDGLISGFQEDFAGKRLSAVIGSDPKFGLGLKLLYDLVQTGGQPIGYRGRVGGDMRGAQFLYHENAILPFGPEADAVDHLLIVSAITLRTALAGVKIPGLVLALLLTGCAAATAPGGGWAVTPTLHDDVFVTRDGAALPLRHWDAAGPPRAIIIALHGMSDYSNAFDGPGKLWAADGITTLAYDQRGFGRGPNSGLWPGSAALRGDLEDFVAAARARYPGMPLFALGESMGGAVLLTALAEAPGLKLDGAILVAPAVWSRADMPLSYRVALFLAAHLTPGLVVSGNGLKIEPSDNIAMLRALSRDPYFQKQTRADAVYGLVDLMDEARQAAAHLAAPPPLLFLYGHDDQIIPPQPTKAVIALLGARAAVRAYDKGYHMLLRDLEGPKVSQDVADWVLTGPQRKPD